MADVVTNSQNRLLDLNKIGSNVDWDEFKDPQVTYDVWKPRLTTIERPITLQVAQDYLEWLNKNFEGKVQVAYFLNTEDSTGKVVPELGVFSQNKLLINCYLNLKGFPFITLLDPAPEEKGYLEVSLSPESHFWGKNNKKMVELRGSLSL